MSREQPEVWARAPITVNGRIEWIEGWVPAHLFWEPLGVITRTHDSKPARTTDDRREEEG